MSERGLLYDHLCNHASQRGLADPLDLDLYRRLRAAPVYEITNVYPLFDDWNRERESQIPKTPPHEFLWAEWGVVMEADEMNTALRIGCIVKTMGREVARLALDNPDAEEGFFERHEQFVVCIPFFRIDRVDASAEIQVLLRSFPNSLPLGSIAHAKDHTLWALSESGKVSDSVRLDADGPGNPRPFGLPLIPLPHDLVGFFSWPPLMAFGLLHCRNVSTEVVQREPQSPRHRKQGLPPKKAYHVLRLELPNEVRPHAPSASEEESERKMRFHLCRGHFKNLQHERFKSKGWHWWPAHWRGSKALGEIEKRYELHPKQSE